MRNVLNLNFIQCSEDRLLLCQAYVTQSAYNKYLTRWLWSTCITACWCYVSELGIYDKTWTKIRTSSTTTVSCVCLCISYRLFKAEPKDEIYPYIQFFIQVQWCSCTKKKGLSNLKTKICSISFVYKVSFVLQYCQGYTHVTCTIVLFPGSMHMYVM